MKNVFDRLNSTLNVAEERISEFEVISIEIFKREKQTEKNRKIKKE